MSYVFSFMQLSGLPSPLRPPICDLADRSTHTEAERSLTAWRMTELSLSHQKADKHTASQVQFTAGHLTYLTYPLSVKIFTYGCPSVSLSFSLPHVPSPTGWLCVCCYSCPLCCTARAYIRVRHFLLSDANQASNKTRWYRLLHYGCMKPNLLSEIFLNLKHDSMLQLETEMRRCSGRISLILFLYCGWWVNEGMPIFPHFLWLC